MALVEGERTTSSGFGAATRKKDVTCSWIQIDYWVLKIHHEFTQNGFMNFWVYNIWGSVS